MSSKKKPGKTAEKPFSARDPFTDLRPLESLCERLRAQGVTDLEWASGNQKFAIRFGGSTRPASAAPIVLAPHAAEPAASVPSSAAKEEKGKTINSPFVGTFYRSPSPGVDPYVKEGSRIETGDVICIIEAMKLMNEIEAEVSGVVLKILVENGQPVEFGEPLFLVG